MDEGLTHGAVNSIAQTPDGYLWIGTQNGLVRFDGLNFRLYNRADFPGAPDGPVLGLVADRSGNLWIRSESMDAIRFRSGIFEPAHAIAGPQETGVTAI